MNQNHSLGPLDEQIQEPVQEPVHMPIEMPDDTIHEPGTEGVAVPFGEGGAAFLRNLLQHAVFLGIVVLIIMFVQILRPFMMMLMQ